MAPTSKFMATTVHAAPVFMDKAGTIKKVISLIEQVGKEGIALLVFPETFLLGCPYWIECYTPLNRFSALAKHIEESVTVESNDTDLGAIPIRLSERTTDGFTLFNSQVLISSTGPIFGVHRKLQPTYAERYVWGKGSGSSLKTWKVPELECNVGGLACWEHTMNGTRQVLIMQDEHIHAGTWLALSTMKGFEEVADAQIEALMKTYALTALVFVITTSNYGDKSCLEWMGDNLGEQDLLDMVKVWVDTKGHYR
ncbi:carbon-nitrogen hydrolase [Zopfia rhizophila CBS 207.26]|uniref:Carbon-nitrogen hydrolase n=1 Tax=Zopfia rhizophila CBS 207.26 TaxID=1314779 RepID=A0A6A6DH83_9PEZI|nr:carbon-nitrogen hydrolase [Zopfia rhizophila CBS 207.26]